MDNVGTPVLSNKMELPEDTKLFPDLNKLTASDREKVLKFKIRILANWTKVRNNDPVKGYQFNIELKNDAIPFRARPRRYSELDSKFLKEWVADLLDRGWIKRNPAARWVSPVIVVGGKRGVVDLRRLNQATVPTAYPLPHIDVILSKVKNAKFFARLDLKSGYWQVECDANSGEYMSFMTDEGVFTPSRLIMGCTNGVFAFQALMVEILDGINNKIVWIDDILLWGGTIDELLHSLTEVYIRFKNRNVKINWEKSEFLLTKVKFLGRIIDGNGVLYDDEFTKSIIDIPLPQNGGQLGQFLNMANHMRIGLVDFARISKNLYELMESVYAKGGSRTKRKTAKVMLDGLWTSKHTLAFENVKQTVANQMKCSFVDPENDLYLVADASEDGWCLLVAQAPQQDREKPFLQRALSPVLSLSGLFKGSSLRWHIIQKELFPFVRALDRLSYLLHRHHGFVVLSDNRTLTHILNPSGYLVETGKSMFDRVSRWLLKFCGYLYHVEPISGEENYFCDLVSRWGASRPKPDSINAIHIFEEGEDKGIVESNDVPLAGTIEDIEIPDKKEFKIKEEDIPKE